MDERCNYIRSKYVDHKFIKRYCRDEKELVTELENAIKNQNIHQLLQVFAEGVDLTAELPCSVIFVFIILIL